MVAKNTICLWYDGTALDAAQFYAATFADSAVGAVHRAPSDYPSGKQGDVLTVQAREGSLKGSVAHLQQGAWKRAPRTCPPGRPSAARCRRHAFRHLAVTRWLRASVPLRTAARWGGWKDVATMLRWYESPSPAMTSWQRAVSMDGVLLRRVDGICASPAVSVAGVV